MNATSGSMLGGNSTLGVSALGASALGKPLGGLVSSTVGSHNQSADAQVQFARLQEKIEGIVGAWDARNPATCRFQVRTLICVRSSDANIVPALLLQHSRAIASQSLWTPSKCRQ